jgi:hypothetical protein
MTGIIFKGIMTTILSIGIFVTIIGTYNLMTYYKEPNGAFFLIATVIFIKWLYETWKEKEE